MLHPSLTLSGRSRTVRLVVWQRSPDARPMPIGHVRQQRTNWVAVTNDQRIIGRFPRVAEAANGLRLHLLAPVILAHFPEATPDRFDQILALATDSATEHGEAIAGTPGAPARVPSTTIQQRVATPANPLPSRPPWATSGDE